MGHEPIATRHHNNMLFVNKLRGRTKNEMKTRGKHAVVRNAFSFVKSYT
jgi:hypothetical protein